MAESFKIDDLEKQFKRIDKKLKSIRTPVDRRTADNVAAAVIREMKTMILRGISPIQGKGRFPRYKNPKKYPGKRKPSRPVNLRLTGQFLKSLMATSKSSRFGWNTVISIPDTKRRRSKSTNADLEKGHREGANTQPKRPIIPQGSESFAVRIKKKYIKLYTARIVELLKKKLR